MKLGFRNGNAIENRTRDIIIGEIIVALAGLFMLINPELALTVVIYLMGICLIVIGAFRVISYFRNDIRGGIVTMSLAVGLALITGGILLLVFPLIPTYAMFMILGGILIGGGFTKIQMAYDVKRLGDERWWILLIASCASLIMGILALFNPFGVAVTLTMVLGCFLIVESAIDIYCALSFKKKVRDLFKDV
ncbi:MAG: DUF308 domain-containing protein [Clostridia bacterium]|nr:DUF308 domain-containing protein [Clostridia bacterium]